MAVLVDTSAIMADLSSRRPVFSGLGSAAVETATGTAAPEFLALKVQSKVIVVLEGEEGPVLATFDRSADSYRSGALDYASMCRCPAPSHVYIAIFTIHTLFCVSLLQAIPCHSLT